MDTVIANPILHSACVGTSCVGVDSQDNFIQTSDGTNWTSPVNIGAATGLTAKGIDSIACATPTLCVVGDGEGDTSTYAIPPNPTPPTVTGAPTVGQTLTLAHGTVQNSPVWFHDDWFRCDNPGVTCKIDLISTSTSSYTLVAADAGEYIEARESVGFGFDIEGFLAGDHLVSNIIGLINTPGGGSTSHTLTITKSGTGSGTVTSAPAGINCGAACSASFNSGTQVTLTETAAAGSRSLRMVRWRLFGYRQLRRDPELQRNDHRDRRHRLTAIPERRADRGDPGAPDHAARAGCKDRRAAQKP